MADLKRKVPKGWKPPLYSLHEEPQVERFETLPEVIDPTQAEVLYLRMLEAWPFLAKRRLTITVGPDAKGLYATFVIQKKNGKVHMTIAGRNFE